MPLPTGHLRASMRLRFSDRLRAIALPSVRCATLAQSTNPPRAAVFFQTQEHRPKSLGDPRHGHLSLGGTARSRSSMPPQYMGGWPKSGPPLQVIGLVMSQNSPATTSHQKGYTSQNISERL